MSQDIIYTEPDLLRKIAIGDENAFRIIFEKFWPRIYANALKFTKSPEQAKDLGQDIFLKVWSNREKLPSVERFDAYLFRLAKNTIFDFFDKRTLATANEEYLSVYFEDKQASVIQELEAKDLESKIEKVISTLPEQVRTAFTLSRKEGLTHAEIAERMGISHISSKSYISRAILTIKKNLAEGPHGVIISGLTFFIKQYYFLIIFFETIAFHLLFLPSLFL